MPESYWPIKMPSDEVAEKLQVYRLMLRMQEEQLPQVFPKESGAMVTEYCLFMLDVLLTEGVVIGSTITKLLKEKYRDSYNRKIAGNAHSRLSKLAWRGFSGNISLPKIPMDAAKIVLPPRE